MFEFTQKTFSTNRPRRFALLPMIGALALLLTLSGCASMKDFLNMAGKKQVNLDQPPQALILKGLDSFHIGRYDLAEKYFNQILNRYPFSPQAELAELKQADCKYYMGNYSEALLLYKKFEEKHPTNEVIPYVMYQKGMCDYNRIDTIDRDTDGAIKAIQDFNQLLRAYPVSPYTDDAKARIRAAKEFLANHEFFVVKFYLRTHKYKEAEYRLKYMIAMYPNSMLIPRAKKLLAQLEAGHRPPSGFMQWLSELSLPRWSTIFSSKAITIPESTKGK